MDKVLEDWLKANPKGTKKEFNKYWVALNQCLDVRAKEK